MNTPRLLFLPLLLVTFFFLSCSEDATNEPATVRISGLVQKAGNADPLPGADVIVSRHDNSEVLGRTLTDSSGVFLVEGLPATLMDIRVEAAGFAPVLFESMDPTTSDVAMQNMTVQMVAVDTCCSGVLILTVKNGSGEKLKNVPVVIKRAGVVIDDPRTDENGKIIVDGLCPGDYSLRIALVNYKVYEAVFTINSSCEPVEMTAELQMENEVCCDGVLTVTVKNPQGGPILGAQVRVWKGGAVLHKSFTDSSGVVVITDLCKGEYGVDVIKTGWTDREFTFAINGECDPVSKAIVMEQLACCDGVLTLVVRDANNNPVQNAKVQVRKGSKTIEDPVTDANGRIVVDGLCAGEYNYRISKEGYKVVEGTFVIGTSCDPVTREVSLESDAVCCSGVLTVTAVDSSSTPVAGATVKVWKNGVVLKTAQTDASGKAVFDGLCKGEYGVDVVKTGFQGREFSFAINGECDPFNKTVELLP